MTAGQWHEEFNPQKFLNAVDRAALIERSQTYRPESDFGTPSRCLRCAQFANQGLVLNDGSRICSACFDEVSQISFPETYEMRRRRHYEQVEARRLARRAFEERYGKKEPSELIGVLAVVSLALLYFGAAFVAAPLVLGAVHFSTWTIQKARYRKWNMMSAAWDSEYPTPPDPELRHFHDPLAILTERDRVVLKIFNNWPGYPPFWGYLRARVLSRDDNHCQVTGCPSRVSLHVHHRHPVASGGEHVPDNLVTLCDFHHALEPESGHERIWGAIKTRYFTLVHEHVRANRMNVGSHIVRAHLRRLELVGSDDINAINEYYSFRCATCHNAGLKFSVLISSGRVRVHCKTCGGEWEGERALAEETGPRIAESFPASRRSGTWPARWQMLDSRTNGTFMALKSLPAPLKPARHRSRLKKRAAEIRACPSCGSPMRLVTPPPGKTWKPFWGCSKYSSTGCRGSARVE